MAIKSILLLFVVFFSISSSSPIQKPEENIQETLKKIRESLDIEPGNGPGGEEYARYWKELVDNNPDLARKLKGMSQEDIAKQFGDRLAHRENNIRTTIDELQRINLEKMRRLNSRNPPPSRRSFNNQQETAEDVQKKMQEHRRIQQQLDHLRRTEFEQFENRVENMRRKKLREMNEAKRLKEEQRLEELAQKHKEHEKMQHPASKKQLEDVWVKQDGLGDEKFDPKTFFYIHDKNGDRFLDVYEMEALFMNELKKVYGDANNMAVQEELAEMREHVFGEVDRNQDGLVSLEEFMQYAGREIFDVDEEWKPLEERDNVVLPDDINQYDYVYDEVVDNTQDGKLDNNEEHHQPDPQTQPHDPQTQPHDPQAQPHDPQTQPHDPQAQPHDPQAQPHNPQAQPNDPQTQPHDPQTQPNDQVAAAQLVDQLNLDTSKLETASKDSPHDNHNIPAGHDQPQQAGNI